ncbi:MAG: AraC family transcriptional regulator ligand-binding domain-containing protein [Bermanella sp.]
MTHTLNKTVSAIAVVDLANELIMAGVLSESELKYFSSEVFAQYILFKQGDSIVEQRLAEAHLVSLWNEVDKTSNFAFKIGCTVNNQAKGVLANWISHSDSLAQAFDIFTHNVALLNHAEHWQLITSDMSDDVILEFEHISLYTYPHLAIERSMVAIIAWANYFVGQSLDVKSASFTYSEPNHSYDYHDLFGENIVFNANVNRIILAKSEFNQPLDSANPYLRDILKERAQSINLSMNALDSTVASVQVLLLKNLTTFSNIENVLGSLHMSRATLYRKLKDEGTTFSQLVKQARLNKLRDLKETALSSEVRAEQLGFSDVSSYYRFIKS